MTYKFSPVASRFTMPKWITHEPLAAGWFNLEYTSGHGHLASWAKPLTNTAELVQLLVERLEKDYVALAVKTRKPWGKDVAS